MIERLHETNILGEARRIAPSNFELMEKINEIIDKVNELDIKLQIVKYFTPESEKAIKELLKLLEKDNSVGELLGDEK